MRSIFVDIARNYGALSRIDKGSRINYEKYLKRAANGDRIHTAIAYGININDEADDFIDVLRDIGYEVKYRKARMVKNKENNDNILETISKGINNPEIYAKEALKNKKIIYEPKIHLTTNNVLITLDIIKSLSKVDKIVIGSNDKELIPVIEYVRNMGVRVHILSLAIPIEMKDVSDSYAELDDNILEYKD